MKKQSTVHLLVTGLFLFSRFSWSATEQVYVLKSATVDYTAKHSMHDTHAQSHAAKGKGLCSPSKGCEFLMGVPVQSFDSGNGNRDTHMWKVTRAADFPLVSVRVSTPLDPVLAKAEKLKPQVSFAGQEATLVVEKFSATRGEKGNLSIDVEGHFRLQDFKIEAPSLLGLAVQDAVTFQSHGEWELQP